MDEEKWFYGFDTKSAISSSDGRWVDVVAVVVVVVVDVVVVIEGGGVGSVGKVVSSDDTIFCSCNFRQILLKYLEHFPGHWNSSFLNYLIIIEDTTKKVYNFYILSETNS